MSKKIALEHSRHIQTLALEHRRWWSCGDVLQSWLIGLHQIGMFVMCVLLSNLFKDFNCKSRLGFDYVCGFGGNRSLCVIIKKIVIRILIPNLLLLLGIL